MKMRQIVSWWRIVFILPPVRNLWQSGVEKTMQRKLSSESVFSSLLQFNASVVFQFTSEDIGLFAFNNLVEIVSNTDFL